MKRIREGRVITEEGEGGAAANSSGAYPAEPGLAGPEPVMGPSRRDSMAQGVGDGSGKTTKKMKKAMSVDESCERKVRYGKVVV